MAERMMRDFEIGEALQIGLTATVAQNNQLCVQWCAL